MFAIALNAVLDDTPRNAFVEEFRPALWTEAQKTLPKSVFDYSVKALRKALTSLKSAYGPVRQIHRHDMAFWRDRVTRYCFKSSFVCISISRVMGGQLSDPIVGSETSL